jgi:hypothetical protein
MLRYKAFCEATPFVILPVGDKKKLDFFLHNFVIFCRWGNVGVDKLFVAGELQENHKIIII